MKKIVLKLMLNSIYFLFIISSGLVYASNDLAGDETVIKNIASSLLNVLMWIAYAFILGAILFVGIKYMLSTANEKANIKGILPKLIIGVVAITCCFSIAKFVANVAGNDKAEDIVELRKRIWNRI